MKCAATYARGERFCVDLLLDAETFPAVVLDPACGIGTIVKACRARGIDSYGTDIAERGFGRAGVDFLTAEPPSWRPASVICNPPYSKPLKNMAELFARRALEVATEKVAMLVQQKWLYSQRRHRLFTEHAPARLYFISSRPSMPPGEKLLAGTVEAKGGKVDYLWVVWDRAHTGPTTAHWLKRGAA